MRDDCTLRGAYLSCRPELGPINSIGGIGEDETMSTKTNATTISNELNKHIDLVISELRYTSGARVIAAAAGIEEGINFATDDCHPDELMAHGEDLIGMEAVYEGYD